MFPLDDNFVFGDIFFLWLILSQQKKILTNKRSYSSNGNTYMPMIWRFYAPQPPPQRKNIQLNILFFFAWLIFFFCPKKRPYYAIFNWSLFILFFIPHCKSHFFLPLWTFRSFWNCENHDFFLKTIETWYKFLIVILFFKKEKIKKPIFSNTLRKNNINI